MYIKKFPEGREAYAGGQAGIFPEAVKSCGAPPVSCMVFAYVFPLPRACFPAKQKLFIMNDMLKIH